MSSGTPRCGACAGAVESDAAFCRHCGARLRVAVAEVSGQGLAAVARAPVAAGNSVSLPPAWPPAAPADGLQRAATAYLGEGELKQATVLFADVQGSVALAAQVEPEDWHDLVGGFFGILGDAVRRYGGTVSRFTGDGVMALFGAPLAQEDHARRACLAALDARDAVSRYAGEVRRSRGLGFSVRFGLHSGDVVATWVGDGLPGPATAVGRTVGLAERIEELAEPGKIYLTEGTAGLVDGFFELADLGRFAVAGLEAPLRVHELRGRGPAPGVAASPRARGRSRFVGRGEELSRLERALERALAGQGQIVEVVGEAGVGKSRLCSEILARCRQRDLAVAGWHNVSYVADAPFVILVEHLRRWCELAPGEPDEVARARVEARLRDRRGDLARFLPLVFDVLGLGAGDGAPSGLGERERAQALGRLVAELAVSAGRRGPAVVLIEDVHWLGTDLEDILEAFLATVPTSGMFVLLTRRSDQPVRHRSPVPVEQVVLPPLGVGQATELLRELLGDDASVAGLEGSILERARGNPYFIEEIVCSLAESGVLAGERGRFRVARPVDVLRLPATLQATLGARIDRLPPLEKRVLQVTAVVGRDVRSGVLARVAGLGQAELDEALASLVQTGFLARGEGADAGQYHFCHPLLQEEAYFSQLGATRRRTHAAVARALVDLEPARADERGSLLAQHWESAGDRIEAARWMGRAGAWSAARNIPEALRCWRRALALVEGLPDAEARRIAVEASIRVLDTAMRTGLSPDEARRIFDAAERLAREAGDERALGDLTRVYAQARGSAGNLQETVELTERALARALEAGDEELAGRLRLGLTVAYYITGRFREVHALAEGILAPWPADRSAAAADGERPPDLHLVRMMQAMAALHLGRIEAARDQMKVTCTMAERAGALDNLCMCHCAAPGLAEVAGDDPAEALEHALRAVEIAERLASPAAILTARWSLGLVQLLRGDWREAESLIGAALAAAREQSVNLQGEAAMLAHLAAAALWRGEVELGRARAAEAVEIASRRGTMLYECFARLVVAWGRLVGPDPVAFEEVEGDLRRAGALIRAQGYASLEAPVHLVRALAARRAGDAAGAEAEMRTAHRLFLAIGARGHAAWLEALLPPGGAR